MASDRDVAFPTLSERDLAALAARGHPREVHAGDLLFEEGDRNPPFFVVQEGGVEIVEHSRGTPYWAPSPLGAQRMVRLRGESTSNWALPGSLRPRALKGLSC